MITNSERLFERYCARRGYTVERIPCATSRTADYFVSANGHRVVVEVKEISTNDEDIRFAEAMRRDGFASGTNQGERLRRRLRRACDQLRRHRALSLPCVAVIRENISLDFVPRTVRLLQVSPEAVDMAMYGAETARVTLRTNKPHDVRDTRGGNRVLTAAERCYVSALSILHGDAEPFVATYHNFYAARPLPPGIFSGRGDYHFLKRCDPASGSHAWVDATIVRA